MNWFDDLDLDINTFFEVSNSKDRENLEQSFEEKNYLIGEYLRAPSDSSKSHHKLVEFVKRDDRIFHYDTHIKSIIGFSYAESDAYQEIMHWKETSGTQFIERPGFKVNLKNFTPINPPISFDILKSMAQVIYRIRAEIESHYVPSYFPFTERNNNFSPNQGYLFYCPPKLKDLFFANEIEYDNENNFNTESRDALNDADENVTVSSSSRNEFDPDKQQSGRRLHAATQNKLKNKLNEIGITAIKPLNIDPPFDIAWELNEFFYLGEVKSINKSNYVDQLRKAIGQIFDYRAQLLLINPEYKIKCIIVTSSKTDNWDYWKKLCLSIDILLINPDDFDNTFDNTLH